MRLLTIVCLLLAGVPATAQEWPFAGRGLAVRGGDFYNLGLLGIKAEDAAKPPAAENAPPQTGKRSVQMERPTNDDGPERFRIVLLFPEGPAAKAGLKKGDILVITLEKLAKALLKAEASKGELTLRVIPAGSTKAAKVKVTIPVGGKAAAKPTDGKGRQAIVDAALAWLAKRQQQDGSYPETLSGKNGAVVQVALAGLAWLGAGSTLAEGPYKDNLQRAADWVAESVRSMGAMTDSHSGQNWNQTNWGLSYAAMFLGELCARSEHRGARDALHYCAAQLVKNQEGTGGWAHGPGGKNALGYIELNIVSGLALCGLGVAKRNGFDVPKDCLARADAYLSKSGSGDGGVAYSHVAGQAGQGNIGRTAGAWIGYMSLGLGKSGWGRKMGAYVKRHAPDVLGGHASLMQHVQLAGIAAHIQGKTARKDFWKAMLRDFVLARAPDGSLQPRPWHESIAMGSNSDVSVGEVWTTASWACVLVAEGFVALGRAP